MPADPSIYGLIQQPRFQSPLDSFAKAQSIRGMLGGQELQELQLAQLRQQASEDAAVREAYSRLQPGQDIETLLPDVMRASPKAGLGLQKNITDNKQAAVTLKKAQVETQIKQIQQLRDQASTVQDDNGLAALRENAMRLYGPDAIKGMPQSVSDPNFSQWRESQLMTADKFLERVKPNFSVQDFGGVKGVVQSNQLATGGVTGMQPKTMTPNESANSPFTLGPNGPVPNIPVQGFQLRKATASAPKVSLSTEKKYGEQFAGNIAKADSDMRDTAIKALDLAQRANQVKEVISSGKVITGTLADVRLAIGKALNLAGASDAETIANTEALSVDLARNTLDSIKTSGLGSGSGFSNADREFVEKAAGGKIKLEGATIDRLANLAHRAAQKSAERWNTRVKEIPPDALQGTGVRSDPVQVPNLYQPKASAPATSQPQPKASGKPGIKFLGFE